MLLHLQGDSKVRSLYLARYEAIKISKDPSAVEDRVELVVRAA